MLYTRSKENLNPNTLGAAGQGSVKSGVGSSRAPPASNRPSFSTSNLERASIRGTLKPNTSTATSRRDILSDPRKSGAASGAAISVNERLRIMESITSDLMSQLENITIRLGSGQCAPTDSNVTSKALGSGVSSTESLSCRNGTIRSTSVTGRGGGVGADSKLKTTSVRSSSTLGGRGGGISRSGSAQSSRTAIASGVGGTLSTVSDRLKFMEDTTLNLKAKVEHLTGKLNQVVGELDMTSKDKNLLEEQVSTYSKIISETQERNKELMKMVEEAERHHKIEMESLNSKFLLSESNLEKSEFSLKTTRGELNRLQLIASDQAEKIQDLETSLLESRIKYEKQEGLASQRAQEIVELKDRICTLKDQISLLEAQASADEQTRRKLHNIILELKGNIRVFCRVKPGSESDQIRYLFNKYDKTYMEIVQKQAKDVTGCKNAPDKHYVYHFDHVFPMDSDQSSVFNEISQLVQSALDGYNTCIFAYGQTGSGKTYTMEGPEVGSQDEESEGMITRAVRQIFDTSRRLGERGWEYQMYAGFLEIYNEQLRDLLDPKNADTKKCEIKHDHEGGKTTVTNQTIVQVRSPAQVEELLRIASKNRSVGSTLINERSSRSHCVFQLRLVGKNTVTLQSCEGVLNLIDLAGSERVSVSGVVGDRFTETKNINKSLSCLNDVISALANKEKHIPYRNSKLTWLLQNYLGGNSKTLMFVNISPDLENINETLNSLRFASRVNTCEIGTAKRGGKIDLNCV